MSPPLPIYHEGRHLREATAGDLVLAFIMIAIVVRAGGIIIKRTFWDAETPTFIQHPTRYSMEEFRAYLAGLKLGARRPKFPTLHNTGCPLARAVARLRADAARALGREPQSLPQGRGMACRAPPRRLPELCLGSLRSHKIRRLRLLLEF